MDPIVQFKEMQKVAWANFATLESITGTAAPRLVRFAGIAAGAAVLDVACGTGVVALTAARLGARVTGIDLTPQLVARAAENAALMRTEAEFLQGDAEALPVPPQHGERGLADGARRAEDRDPLHQIVPKTR